MSFWGRVGDMLDYLQKPAGAWAGVVGGTAKALGGKQFDPEGQLGYDDPLEGLIKGWKKPEGMYRTMNKLYGDYQEPGTLESLLGGVSDIGYDPLILTGPMGGSSSVLKDVPVLGKIAQGAGTAGKLGEEASILTKGGQYGRRYLTGLRLTGDPLSAIPVAGIQGAAERGISGLAKSKALTNVLSRGKSAVPVVEEAVEDVATHAADVAPDVEETVVTKAKPIIKAPKTTPEPVPLDIDDLEEAPPAAAVNKLLALRDAGKVTPEAVATATPRRPPPVISAPPRAPNPNIEAGLGVPLNRPLDLAETPLGPTLRDVPGDVPGWLRKGPTTPQEAAIQSIVEGQVDQDFDNWRRAAIGPFTPTRQSEQTMLPEQLAYFMQNYGQ